MIKFDIVTFGSAVIDNFITTNIEDKNKFFSYPVGSKILINELKQRVGGGGINAAVAFSRLGFKTGSIVKIGKDIEGMKVLELLKKEKITFMGNFSDKRTGQSIILDSKNKDRTILTFKGPGNDIAEKEIKPFKTKWAYFSSMLEKSFQTQKNIAIKLIKNGTKIAFNPSNYLIENKDILPILKISEVVIINKEEAQKICARYNKVGSLEKEIHSLGPKIVVITDGANGAKCFDGKKEYSLPAKKIKVIEITGAGDAFAAGFVAGQMANWSIEKCLKMGIEESSAIISHIGSKKSLPRRKLIFQNRCTTTT